jgi:phosphatidylserine decarboxylase
MLSPADGRVIEIVDTKEGKRLSIFLALYNVHVFRAPVAGKIETLEIVKGKYHPAYKLEASTENSRVKVGIKGEYYSEMDVIAGVAARRIKPWKKINDTVKAGDLMGIVMFGSRTDIYIPEKFELYVKIGDKVRGGLTKIGRYL